MTDYRRLNSLTLSTPRPCARILGMNRVEKSYLKSYGARSGSLARVTWRKAGRW